MKKTQKPLDKAIVTQSASKRNTFSTKKQCQLSRRERFQLAVENQKLTDALQILESVGIVGNTATFMIACFQQMEVAA